MIFESFSVILRQISLGVHSYAVVHFPCLTKKSFKNRDLGLFSDTATNVTRSTDSTPSLIFLVLRKNPAKIEIWVFSEILRQISLGVHLHAVVHFPCLTKKSFKNRDFWVFAVTLGQMSLGVHSHAVVHFPTERPSV